MTITDLAIGARRGEREAFAELVSRVRDSLVMTARAMLRDRHEAEDAAQEALVTAYRKLGTLDRPERFMAWLATILFRLALARLDCGRRSRPAGGLADLPGREPPDHARLEDLRHAVEALPGKYRIPLALHYLSGLSYRDVAEVTGLTEKRVKSRLHDARALLRRRLGHED